jgi:hydrogenase nickel incorporation protein HypB
VCQTCGCGQTEKLVTLEPSRGKRTIRVEQAVLAKNDALADANRERLRAKRILALNVVSSPGSGKTTLLERTLRDLKGKIDFSVVEGDQETDRDAERIRATGVPALQVNTGAGCHLDASMVARALDVLEPREDSILFVENVGNLVCPALFDLGEAAKIVVASVTEGDDKPLKYPHAFRASSLLVLNKIDLLPYVSFSVERCIEAAKKVNPEIEALTVSATRGDGMDAFYSWIERRRLHGSR